MEEMSQRYHGAGTEVPQTVGPMTRHDGNGYRRSVGSYRFGVGRRQSSRPNGAAARGVGRPGTGAPGPRTGAPGPDLATADLPRTDPARPDPARPEPSAAGRIAAGPPRTAPAYDTSAPGHTKAFDTRDLADYPAGPERPGGEPGPGPRPGRAPRVPQGSDREAATVYRAGQPHPGVSGARLRWRPLLAGIYRRPARTFTQMRGHQVWGPALTVSGLYGVLAVMGFGSTRNEVLGTSFSLAVFFVLSSAIGIIIAGLMFGAVTHVLARRLGGDGAWMPTIGLAMLVMWTTDAPRLLMSFFLPESNLFLQGVGWLTWLLCAVLLTSMVREVHDLPWGKALAAAGVQLIALLLIIKLPTLG